MKSKRIRAILKAKGYNKKGKAYKRPCICFNCNGSSVWHGWISKGMYPHVETCYEPSNTCSWCKGTGKDTEVTCVEFEKDIPFQ